MYLCSLVQEYSAHSPRFHVGALYLANVSRNRPDLIEFAYRKVLRAGNLFWAIILILYSVCDGGIFQNIGGGILSNYGLPGVGKFLSESRYFSKKISD